MLELINREVKTQDALRKMMYADDLVIVAKHRDDWKELFVMMTLSKTLCEGDNQQEGKNRGC